MIYVRILSDFLFFFFTLFIVSTAFSIAIAQISLGVSLFLFIIIMFLKKENPFAGGLSKFYIAIGLYISWMILSALFGDTPIASLLILKEEWLFCAIPIGIYILQKDSFRKKITISLFTSLFLIGLYGFLQHFTGFHWFKSPLVEAYDYGFISKGFFPHRLTFGNYTVTALGVVMGYLLVILNTDNLKQKVIFIVISILLALATIFSYSYGPILTLFVIILIFSCLRFKKYALYAFLLLVIVSTVVISFKPVLKERISKRVDKELTVENEASRAYIWYNSWRMIKENPVFGVGQGNYYPTFEKNMSGHRIHVHAHNDVINIASIGGIPAMIFFVYFWFLYLRHLFLAIFKQEQLQKYNRYMVAGFIAGIAFFCTSLTEATFADEEVRQFLMAVMAFGLFPFLSKEANNSKNQETNNRLKSKKS